VPAGRLPSPVPLVVLDLWAVVGGQSPSPVPLVVVLDLQAVSAATRLLSAARAAVAAVAGVPSPALAGGAGVAPVAGAAEPRASPMSI
jgi:hypothetical protein